MTAVKWSQPIDHFDSSTNEVRSGENMSPTSLFSFVDEVEGGRIFISILHSLGVLMVEDIAIDIYHLFTFPHPR